MPQQTRVFKLDEKAAKDLEASLQIALPQAEWRRVPYARFALKHDGVVITCYQSGKVVVQGAGADAFADRFLGSATSASKPAKSVQPQRFNLEEPAIGSDETGKGDYFGPLVVAAVQADVEGIVELQRAGVTDSKQLTDKRMMVLAPFLRDLLDCETARLMPSDYNVEYAKTGNLNELLAHLHARCLAPLLSRHGEAMTVIVDKFAAEKLLVHHLEEAGAHPKNLVCVPRAEAHPVVAAASVLARSEFLEGLAECSELCGTDLHKGAGAPVDKVGRSVWRVGGDDLLAKVAKLHFKNTGRVRS